VDYATYGYHGYEAYDRKGIERPPPPAINHQIDVAIAQLNKRTERELLKALNAAIFQPGIKTWYEIYLTFFVLLFNLEYIHGSGERYISSKLQTVSSCQIMARRIQILTRAKYLEKQVKHVVSAQLEEWEWSARVLLYHFRCVLRDYDPFELARQDITKVREQAKLDDASTNYVREVVHLLEIGMAEALSGTFVTRMLMLTLVDDQYTRPSTASDPTGVIISSKWIPQLMQRSL
jgi:hypothetical protein